MENRSNSKLFKSISIFTGMTLVSRVLGFIRDVLLASIFGAGGTYDAFLVAFKIPNFMRRLFAEGAFSQAFIPTLSEYQANAERENSQQQYTLFINQVAGCLFTILIIISIFGILFSPVIISIFAPGFSQDNDQFYLASDLLKITMPYLMLISLSALGAGVLQINNRFAIPAFSPVLLNIALITAALFLTGWFEQPIYSLAIGVFIGGVLQCGLAWFAVYRTGISIRPDLNWQRSWNSPGVKKIITLMIPAIFGTSVNQINILLDTVFASFLVSGSISWLYYADRLMELPLGLFGVGLGTVILPNLSRAHQNQDMGPEYFNSTLQWGLRSVFLLGMPAALGLLILAGPLLTTLFQFGKFSFYDVQMTRLALMAYAPGVLGLMLVKVLVSGFYARQDMKTPVKLAVVAMILNAALNLALIGWLKHAGLALATSIASLVHSSLLVYFLQKSDALRLERSFILDIGRIALASFTMAVVVAFLVGDYLVWEDYTPSYKVAQLSLMLLVALITYVTALWSTGFKLKRVLR